MAGDYDEYQLLSQRTNEKKTDKGEINILPCQGHYLNPDYFSEGCPLEYKTKAELTIYLAAQTTDHSKGPTNKLKKFIVTSGTETKGNTCVPSTLVTHSQEEADTLMKRLSLHVFLMMIQMYPSLPCDISFLTGKGNLKRGIPVQPVYNKLGHKRASAILGVHALTGSDMSGRFAGRTK